MCYIILASLCGETMENTLLFVLFSFFGSFFFFLFCSLFGTRLFSLFFPFSPHDISCFFLGTGLGIGVFAVLLLILGFTFGYSLVSFFILILFLLLLSLAFLAHYISLLRNTFSFFVSQFSFDSPTCSLLSSSYSLFCIRILCFLFIVFVLLFSLTSLSPETEWDAISFHLAIAKIYVREGYIIPIDYAYHAALPHLFDLLYIVGELFHTDVFSRVFVLLCNVTVVFGIWYLGTRLFSFCAGFFAALTFLTTPILMVYMPSTYIDTPLGLFVLCAFFSFWKWKETLNDSYLFLLALFLSFAITSKIILLPILLAFVLLYIRFSLFSSPISFRKTIFWSFLVCFVVFLFFVPWLVFNFVFFDNPVYPFAEGIFHGRYWSPALAQWWHDARSTYSNGTSVVQYLLKPFVFTYMPNINGPIYGFSPMYLLFIPLVFLYLQKSAVVESVLCILFLLWVYVTGWFILAPDMRYMFCVMPFFALLVGFAIDQCILHFSQISARISSFIQIIFVLVIISNLFLFFVIFRADVLLWTRQMTRDAYITQDTPNYPAALWMNAHLSSDAIVFFANDDKGYYLDRSYITGYGVYSTYIDYAHLSDTDALADRLHALGVTHVLIHTYENGRLINHPEYYTEHTTTLFHELIENYLTLLYEENDVAVYLLQ